MAWFFRNRARDDRAQQNFDQLAAFLTKLGITDMAWGLSSATFTAAGFSAAVVIAHGLGQEPTGVFATPSHGSGITPLTVVVEDFDGTDITVRMYTNPSTTNVSTTQDFFWLAVA